MQYHRSKRAWMVVDHVYLSPMTAKTKSYSERNAPSDLGLYTGNTNSLRATYKQKLKLYKEYEEHKQNIIKPIQECFDEDL